jgi:hypothetical protein
MLMPDIDTVRSWRGRTHVDRDGDRIGSVENIYTDDRSGERPVRLYVRNQRAGVTQSMPDWRGGTAAGV